MIVSYDTAKDEISIKFRPHPRKPSWMSNSGQFKIWWDKDNNICAISVTSWSEFISELIKGPEVQLKDIGKGVKVTIFRRGKPVRLGGIWKGVKITKKDIDENRKELLKKIEERYERAQKVVAED